MTVGEEGGGGRGGAASGTKLGVPNPPKVPSEDGGREGGVSTASVEIFDCGEPVTHFISIISYTLSESTNM